MTPSCEIALYIIENEPDLYGQIFITPKAVLTPELLELLENASFSDIPGVVDSADGYYRNFKHPQELVDVAKKLTTLVKRQQIPNRVSISLPNGVQQIELQC